MSQHAIKGPTSENVALLSYILCGAPFFWGPSSAEYVKHS